MQTECVTLGLERKVIGPMGYCVSVFATTMWVPNLLNVINSARLNETLNHMSFPFSFFFYFQEFLKSKNKVGMYTITMKKEFGKCAYVLETVNTHYINCSMPDIQVRTFVTNFESIFISHLQSGNRAVGCKEQGDNSPSKL